ncbi:MAG: 3-dehydroquinate synthase [Anaerolineae bacterium]|nr:3-dehydroquinate synthase [Anaerolineae bacterium]
MAIPDTPEQSSQNIVLTGFMGTGKTTIGRQVAALLDRRFVDADDVIVERAGMSIPQIFATQGEPAFRALEKEVCRDLAAERGLVIATGGGMLVDPDNRAAMLASGLVVCLVASRDVLRARLARGAERPLAGDWEALLEKRRAAYAAIPDHVDTSDNSPERAAQRIIDLAYGLRGHYIPVKTPTGEYDIAIQRGRLAHLITPERCAVVTNTTLAPLYGEALARRLPDAVLITMPDGEQYKTLDTVAQLYADFVAAGLDRGSTVIALGGGVVGDTAGFAAATYMRGVRLLQIPTSLLAMVDSSVGGKVGVDLPQGKNLVGAFKQPDAVVIDPDVLRTLPEREWRCGAAEAIKHALIADPGLLDLIDPAADQSAMIARAVQVKVDIVQQDPYEQDIRAHLNLGHTFAHAVEQVSGYQWLHGEAVGVGLVAAARLSAALGMLDAADAAQVEAIIRRFGLPTRLGNLDPEELYAAMSTDKKWQGGHSRFVLLEGIGKPAIVRDVPPGQVIEVLASLRGDAP